MAGVTWEGLDEFRRALEALPDNLVQQATPIIRTQAATALADARASYPVYSGNLRDGLELTELGVEAYGVAVRVRNKADHSYLFEHGTETRTFKGQNRGRMPAGKVFIPAAIAARTRMIRGLVDLVRRAGFQVSDPL